MYYILSYKKDKNCPSFIDGVIHESFEVGIYDEPMEQDWHYAEPGEKLAKLPEKLTLVTKDKCYEFDFSTSFGGHIVSERFLSALNGFAKTRWEVSKLSIVDPKGVEMKNNSYFFIRQRREDRETSDVIDFDRSSIQFRKGGEIKNVSSLAIKEGLGLDFFSINETSLLGFVFLSEQAFNELKNLHLKGVDVVSAEQIGLVKRA